MVSPLLRKSCHSYLCLASTLEVRTITDLDSMVAVVHLQTISLCNDLQVQFTISCMENATELLRIVQTEDTRFSPISEHHGRRLYANWPQCLYVSFKTYIHIHVHTHTHTNLQVVDFVVVGVFNVKESDHLLHAVPEHTLQFLRGETHGHNVGLDVWNTRGSRNSTHTHSL